MFTIENSSNDKGTRIVIRKAGLIANHEDTIAPPIVSTIEHELLDYFPAEDAEPWDITGLYVGNPADSVKGIICALDPTIRAIEECETLGANVLITHHPAYLEPPKKIVPSKGFADVSANVVYEALTRGISLMSFHTALDASPQGLRVLPRLLSLKYDGVLQPRKDKPLHGFGARCHVVEEPGYLTLDHLAARCISVFGRPPRVWGDSSAKISSVVCMSGSSSSVIEDCIEQSVTCLICGEVKYHDALNATQAGLTLIELGHDVSELPYAALLVSVLHECGFERETIGFLDQNSHWTYPDAVRL